MCRPQAKFFYATGWLDKIYGCFMVKLEKHVVANLRLKIAHGLQHFQLN